MTDDIKMAVIYSRVIHRMTTDRRDTIAHQEKICRTDAEANGFKVAMCFSDHSSGSSVDRPSLRKMLEFIEQHRADAPTVFVEDRSRLARNMETLLKLREEITKRGGAVHFVEQGREKRKGQVEFDRERD